MLYGRRLDQSLEHVDGSRYALVHAVAKRARQITLWLTADPAELRAESAPPPAPGELVTRDPVALSEAEILDGEVRVRWDPEGLGEEGDTDELGIETDPLLIEGLDESDDDGEAGADLTPALAQVLEEDGGDSGAGGEPTEDSDGDAQKAEAGDESGADGEDDDLGPDGGGALEDVSDLEGDEDEEEPD